MDPALQSFWEEFRSEADEHVATADRLLEQARSNDLGKEEVAELFRAFHSLKGLAHAMDLGGMERVAHLAESLLGLVRDRGAPLDPELLLGLGAAVDQLGRMLAEIARDRSDVAAPDQLLDRLERLHAERRGADGTVAASAPAPAPADSGTDMVGLLAELLGEFLPGVAALAAPALHTDAARKVADSVTALRNAADVLEMPDLAEILAGLSAFAEGAEPETVETRLGLLVRLGRQAVLVGEISKAGAGVDGFTTALAPLIADPLRDQLEVLVAAAGRLGGSGPDAAAAYPPVAAAAGAAGALLDAMGRGRAARLLALAGEGAVAAARGDVPASPALVAAIGAAVAAVAVPGLDPLTTATDLDEAVAAERSAEIRAALSPTEHGGGGAEMTDGRIGGPPLPAVFLPVLSADNRRDLERAIVEGQSVYQVLVDLDALDGQAADSAGMLERLAEIGRTITSRTVPQGDRTWFEFLMVSSRSRADVRSATTVLDPEQRWIKAVRPVGDGRAGANAEPAMPEPRRGPAGAPEQIPAAEAAVLRVRSASLDRLMAAVGHARVTAAALSQILLEDHRKTDAMAGLQRLRERLPPASAVELGRHLDALRDRESELAALDGRLSTGLSQLHADALDLRVVPVDTVLGHLPRMARELAQHQGKQVRIRLKGREVRIDKSVVQQLLDPLMHMMRNSVDHGIELPAARGAAGKPETATITLRARQRSSEFRLEITDDGRGLDAEAIRIKAVERGLVDEEKSRELPLDRIHRFIFEPGFSTAAAVTETSGRGVGMDVVMHTVTRLGGRIDIRTEKGTGTTFVLRLPLSASVLPALVVEVAGESLAIPERHIVAVEEIGAERVRQAGGRRVLLSGNLALPLHSLAGLLGFDAPAVGVGHAVVVASGAASIALEVDRLLRRQELLLRDLHPALAVLPGVGGAALLGDGSPILVLDVDALIELARSGRRRQPGRTEAAS